MLYGFQCPCKPKWGHLSFPKGQEFILNFLTTFFNPHSRASLSLWSPLLSPSQCDSSFTPTYTDFRLLCYLRRNKLQLLYCSLSYLMLFTASYYLRSPILWSVFLSLRSVVFIATNANPQPSLFKVTKIWRNAALPAVRCKSFTFYKIVWWHISCVVGKGVTVCFFSEIT